MQAVIFDIDLQGTKHAYDAAVKGDTGDQVDQHFVIEVFGQGRIGCRRLVPVQHSVRALPVALFYRGVVARWFRPHSLSR